MARLNAEHPELAPDFSSVVADSVAHATTIVALSFGTTNDGGVLMAGDRRATVGNRIASAHMEKVYAADDHSLIGVAGAAGIAIDMARLFSVELEHYEKIEGTPLSLMGKANRLAALVRAQLPQASRGLVALPIFAGVSVPDGAGKIFSFDITGGRFEEHHHHSVGSGAPYAGGTLKRLWKPELSQEQAIEIALKALIDAAEEDAATSGPDSQRGIFPRIKIATTAGVDTIADATIRQHLSAIQQGGAR